MSTLTLIWDVWTRPFPMIVIGVVTACCIGAAFGDRAGR